MIVGIGGLSGAGKSGSLQPLDLEGVLIVNCEPSKKKPFIVKHAKLINLETPMNLGQEIADNLEGIHTIIVDPITAALAQWEAKHIKPAVDTQKMWGAFKTWLPDLFEYLGELSLAGYNIVITYHLKQIKDKEGNVVRITIPISGANADAGVQQHFEYLSTAVKVPISDLALEAHPYLTITEEDLDDGFKHAIQVKPHMGDVTSLIKAPRGTYPKGVKYINGDARALLSLIKESL